MQTILKWRAIVEKHSVNLLIQALCMFGAKNVNEFSDSLYKHRNGIVHGKNDYKSLIIEVPSLIGKPEDYDWLRIVEKIAYDLILKYCYN